LKMKIGFGIRRRFLRSPVTGVGDASFFLSQSSGGFFLCRWMIGGVGDR
jgi:hypothetical protein